jgi:hypothetical protein
VDGYAIEVDRQDLRQRTSVPVSTRAEEGEAIARVDGFAFTANNVTYAVFGEMMGYWRFFPATDAARGVIPVWGFGTITESRAEGLREGDRFYGYWPSATHARLRPGEVKPHGFSDTSPHRQGLADVYNNYIVAGQGRNEAMVSLFRPLFATGYVLAATIGTTGGTVVATSASSKTAIATAAMLKRRGVATIGLTSEPNRAFAESTGVWDRVLPYDEIEALAGTGRATLVDFAGNPALIARAHAALEDLAASWTVGVTAWDAPRGGEPVPMPGPAPQLFFAPTAWAEAAAAQGPAAFEAGLNEALQAFIADAGRWLEVTRAQGADAYAAALDALLDGRADPSEGLYLSL